MPVSDVSRLSELRRAFDQYDARFLLPVYPAPERLRADLNDACLAGADLFDVVGFDVTDETRRSRLAEWIQWWLTEARGDREDQVSGIARGLDHVKGVLPALPAARARHHVQLTLAQRSEASFNELLGASKAWCTAAKMSGESLEQAFALAYSASHYEWLGHVLHGRKLADQADGLVETARSARVDAHLVLEAETFVAQIRAQLLSVEGNAEGAADAYERLVQLRPDWPELRVGMLASAASSLTDAGDLTRARSCLVRAKAEFGETPQLAPSVWLVEAQLLLSEGDPTGALRTLDQFEQDEARLEPDLIWRAGHTRGKALLARGDDAAAMSTLRGVVAGITAGRGDSLGFELDSTRLAESRRVVDDAVELAVRRSEPEVALELLDNFKSWYLAVTLAARRAQIEDLPPALQPLDLEAIVARARDTGQVVVSFFVTHMNVVSVILDGDGVASGVLARASTCFARVEEFAANLTDPYPTAALLDPTWSGISLETLLPEHLLQRVVGATTLVGPARRAPRRPLAIDHLRRAPAVRTVAGGHRP